MIFFIYLFMHSVKYTMHNPPPLQYAHKRIRMQFQLAWLRFQLLESVMLMKEAW